MGVANGPGVVEPEPPGLHPWALTVCTLTLFPPLAEPEQLLLIPSTNTSTNPMMGADCPFVPEVMVLWQLSQTAIVPKDLLVSETPAEVWYLKTPVVGSGPSQVSAGLPIRSPTPWLVGPTMFPVSTGMASPHWTMPGLAPLTSFRHFDQTSR